MAMSRMYEEMTPSVAGSAVEHRMRVQAAEKERAAQRQSEIDAQASPAKEPQERIVLWERLHGVRLPHAPSHVLVRVIATQTRLSVADVHEEQRRRAQPAAF